MIFIYYLSLKIIWQHTMKTIITAYFQNCVKSGFLSFSVLLQYAQEEFATMEVCYIAR